MEDADDIGRSESPSTEEEEPKFVRGVYVYTGPKIIADSKIRLAKWLERRGW